MSRDEKWAELEAGASTRGGMIARVHLLEAGFSASAIARLIRAGRLIRWHPTVYRLRAFPRSWIGDVWAARLAARDPAFFSHRTGAALLGLDGIERKVVEISVPRGRSITGPVVHRIYPDDLPRLVHVDGLPVAQVERVLYDLFAVSSPRTAGTTMDDALRKHMTTLDRLQSQLGSRARRGRNGTRAFRRAVVERDHRDAETRTLFEAKMLRILRRIGRPFEVDFEVSDPPNRYYFDFAFPYARIGIECHSIRWHLGEERWKKDVYRDRRLRLLGWTIFYFTWDEVCYRPDEVEADIRLALDRFPLGNVR